MRRRWFTAAASLAVAVTASAAVLTVQTTSEAAVLPNGFKSVGYMPSWAGSATAIQYSKLTHINYAFALPNANGTLQAIENTAKMSQIVTLGHQNNVRVSLAIGGWNDGNDSGFEALAASATGRTTFVNSVVNVVTQYNLDGVDIDWEYPDPGTSGNNYTLLMQQLSTAMHSRGKLLTAAVVSQGGTANGVQPAVFGYVDWLNIMAYDGGSPHANYDWAIQSANFWKGRGLPAAKTVLGVPFYSRPGYLTYSQLVAQNPANANQDCAGAECYNGLPTIRRKTQWAMANGGGIMNWELSQDATGANSLVSAIFEVATAGQPPVTTPPTGNPPTGGTLLSQGRPATASSAENATFAAANAVDGNTGTRWSSAFSDPQWIQVDLGSARTLNRVVLNWEAAAGRSYQVQTSTNGTTWANAFSTTTGAGGTVTHAVSGSARYVRVNGTARTTQWGYSLWEFQVFGS